MKKRSSVSKGSTVIMDSPVQSEQTIKYDFVETQYQEAIEAFKDLFSLVSQIAAILVAADAAVIGYAITSQSAGVLLVSAVFPMVFLQVLRFSIKTSLPIAYVTLRIEQKYGNQSEIDTKLAWVFFTTVMQKEYVIALQEALTMKDADQSVQAIHKMMSNVGISTMPVGSSILILIIILQLVSPVILYLFLHWPLI